MRRALPPTRRHAALLAALAFAAGCAPPAEEGGSAAAPAAGEPYFDDVSDAVGLDFVHRNGARGAYYVAEVMGAGGGLIDLDGDGDLDLYLVQGNASALAGDGAPEGAGGDAAGGSAGAPRDRIYRNLLIETGALRFADVTAASGIDARGYGMGVAAGDVDGDGLVDLLVTNFGGPDQLWRNRGGDPGGGFVTFEDATARAGLGDPGWSTSASFTDLDQDGDLDLFVARYLDFTVRNHVVCRHPSAAVDYCGPASYRPLVDRLYRNRGDGTFAEITAAAGLGAAFGPGLGTAAADFDDDGRAEILVANDAADNQLWQAEGDGFRDQALLAGCATNGAGQREASMGVAIGDVDNDGDDDLLLTHLDTESDTLYLNQGGRPVTFHDRTRAAGLATPSWPFTGFGTGFLDVDHDGWLDLVVVNGAVKRFNEAAPGGGDDALHQANQLFINRGDGTFEDRSAAAGEVFTRAETSRGAAFGDVDNDGDVDLLVTNNGGRARLARNLRGQDRPWLGLRLVRAGGGDAPGARVGVYRRGAPSLWRRAHRDGSYASASDPRVVVGLGGGAAITGVEVRWPGGARERFPALAPGRYHTLVEGTGEAVAGP